MKPYFLLICCFLFGEVDVTWAIFALSSSPQNLEAASDTIIGTTLIVSIIGFYVVGIVSLLTSLVLTSKEAKGNMFETLEANIINSRPNLQGPLRTKRNSPLIHNANQYMNIALMVDTHYCISKLLCELEFGDDVDHDKLLLKILRENGLESASSGKRKNVHPKRRKLEKVLQLQKKFKTNICPQSFTKCPIESKHLLSLWQLSYPLRNVLNY